MAGKSVNAIAGSLGSRHRLEGPSKYMRNGHVVTASLSRGTTGNFMWGSGIWANRAGAVSTPAAPTAETMEFFKKPRRETFFISTFTSLIIWVVTFCHIHA